MRGGKWLALATFAVLALGLGAYGLASCTQRSNRVGYGFLPPPALLPMPGSTLSTQGTQRTAKQWLDASRTTYATLEAYAEDGFSEQSLGDETDVSRARWQMRFVRAGGFAFRFEQNGFLGTAPRTHAGAAVLNASEFRYLIWQTPGQGVRSRWTVGDGKEQSHESLGGATSAAFGVTKQTSGWTLAMLDAPQFQLIMHPLELENATIVGRAVVDGASCVVISGEWGRRTTGTSLIEDIRVFIDEQTLLVRRWERADRTPLRDGAGLDREVWHVRPLANPTLGVDALGEPAIPLAPWDVGALGLGLGLSPR